MLSQFFYFTTGCRWKCVLSISIKAKMMRDVSNSAIF
jgi:hypothetical protein